MIKSLRAPSWRSAWVFALLMATGAAVADTSPEPLSAFPQSLLAIRTAAGKVVNFKIWDADSPRRQEQGLMFVREMDDHAGMLFKFPTSDILSMWMKNTYLSLDLLFINDDGRIDYIAARATPLALDIISAPKPERAVLELKGGASELFGIKVGDRVIHKHFAAVGVATTQ